MNSFFIPGQVWNDQEGNPIQAHGGSVLYDDGTYYWFGENKNTITHRGGVVGSYVDAIGISCYSSTDLLNWNNRGLVLPSVKASVEHDLHTQKVIERPRVIYNDGTGKYVMFMHVDTRNYKYARVGIAVCDTPAGIYEYIGSIAPNDSDSRDMTVFKEVDGQAYLFHSSEWNATLYIGKLTADYLHTNGTFAKIFPRGFREAPAVFKHAGKYYLITSGCTGWDPNPAEYAIADNILGPWRALGNPCIGPGAEITFHAQSTFAFPVVGRSGAFIAMFDIWDKNDLGASRYAWLPIKFKDGQVLIEWHNKWDLSFFN